MTDRTRSLAEIDADVDAVNDRHPTHSDAPHGPDAFAPEGACERCDALAPLWHEWAHLQQIRFKPA